MIQTLFPIANAFIVADRDGVIVQGVQLFNVGLAVGSFGQRMPTIHEIS